MSEVTILLPTISTRTFIYFYLLRKNKGPLNKKVQTHCKRNLRPRPAVGRVLDVIADGLKHLVCRVDVTAMFEQVLELKFDTIWLT